jgi:choline-sulfatase
MKPASLLFILSDEHNRDAAGCYGHPLVRSPNIDRLAERGARFTNAYTPCPICVPARASLATGRYVHQTGNWDNAFPYDGSIPSWGHRLKEQGYRVDSIGKLHFRSREDDNGFTEEIDPLHVVGGVGDLLGCIREDPPPRKKLDGVLNAGPGSSTYLDYDARMAARAVQWLEEHAADERPWVLFVSFVCPHPPYIAPQRLYDLYPLDRVPLPVQWRVGEQPDHPALRRMREKFGLGNFEEGTLRKAIAAYYGACTYLDERIGELLRAVEENGLGAKTRVLYTSDHGECLGARGLFGKFTMYEESAAVPLILAGADVPEGKVVETPVSLVDCFPTVLEAVGAAPGPEDRDLPGRSLWQVACDPDSSRERTVYSEYHAVNSRSAIYMIRTLRYKYVHYVGEPPQLFDLMSDPEEVRDLAADRAYQPVLQEMEIRLRFITDPEETDARARAEQQARIEAFGGKEAVLRRGTFDNSPVPGEAPQFREVL